MECFVVVVGGPDWWRSSQNVQHTPQPDISGQQPQQKRQSLGLASRFFLMSYGIYVKHKEAELSPLWSITLLLHWTSKQSTEALHSENPSIYIANDLINAVNYTYLPGSRWYLEINSNGTVLSHFLQVILHLLRILQIQWQHLTSWHIL